MTRRWGATVACAVAVTACGRQPIVLEADTDEGGASSTGDDGTVPPVTSVTLDTTAGTSVDTVTDPTVPTVTDTASGPTTITVGTDPTVDPTDATASATTGETDGPLPGGECCAPHDGPGCDEPDLEACVCMFDPFCCEQQWDDVCVGIAETDCMGCVDVSTTAGGLCPGPVVIELFAADAIVSGSWQLTMSMVGEGEILALQNGVDGSVLWQPDLPCDDTWYIWVRYWESGSDDSYFVTLDGMPMPPAIFEGDCTGGGGGYGWALLNWRDPGAGPCTYVEDPWTPDWLAGIHDIELSYRESIAVARIVVTNDPGYVPM